jgi:cephalosporin-C deacetylase
MPAGFDAFWRETTEQAGQAPLDFTREKGNAFDWPGFLIEKYNFRGIDGQTRHGWIATPEDPGPHPAFLWAPPYGRESLLPNAYGTRNGFVSASLNFFGHEAFHQEKYTPGRGYFAEGVLDSHSWVMRSIYQNAVLAARVLREQPEVNAGRVSVMGMSQGGGIAIWLGAGVSWIKAVCADMPFLGGVSQTLGAHVYRYPLKELIDLSESRPEGLERIKATISYFDTLNVATRCHKPVHITLGEKDPAVKPASVEAIFEALPAKKVLKRYPTGHDWFPDMIDNNRNWLLEFGH